MINRRKFFSVLYFILAIILLDGCDSYYNKAPVKDMIESGENINIFVATDIHYLAKDLNDNGKAFQTYLSTGDGKQLNYVEEIVDSFINDIKNNKPDLLIISGDLTNNGEKESHLELANKLASIEKTTGTRVFVIPGNHDIQNPWARGFKDEEQYVTDSISSDDFKKIYKDFGYKEAVSKDRSTLSYMVAPSKDVWLLMLDTNVYKSNYKYGAPATYGKISEETYKWVRECSKLAKKNNARIITVMHHNLLNHNMVLNYGFTLDDNEEAVGIFKESGINLVLSGHVHMQDIKFSKEDTDPIYDIATSSLSVYPVQYGILKYQPGQGFDYSTAQVDVEGWAKKAGIADKNIINFNEYNKNFFSNVSYKKTYDSLTDIGIYSEEDKKLMAETMSLLNINYFAGTTSSIRDKVIETEGYKLWRTASEPDFLTRYVHSMIYNYDINNNELYIPD